MDNSSSGLSENSRPVSGMSLNGGASFRRPATMPGTPLLSASPPVTVTVNKDGGGYGMKVSGDKPVYVQSVKDGGAAQRAGLHSGDKILKVNGVDVRQSTHIEVVAHIKSAPQVVLTVQQRPHRVMGSPKGPQAPHGPPISGRAGITAPLPVNHEKMRQLEFERVQTLRLMLDDEQKHLKDLNAKGGKRQGVERERAEARVRTLQDQLRALGGEGGPVVLSHIPESPVASPEPTYNPHFLSRFPRSLSNLSLGGRGKKSEKESPSEKLNKNDNLSKNACKSDNSSNKNKNRHSTGKSDQKHNKKNNRKSGGYAELSEINENRYSATPSVHRDDTPPPLPQRNRDMAGWHGHQDNVSSASVSHPDELNSPVIEFPGPDTDLDHSFEGLVLNLKDNSRNLSTCNKQFSQSTNYINTSYERNKHERNILQTQKSNSKHHNIKPTVKELRKELHLDVNQAFLDNERNERNDNNCDPPPLPPRLYKNVSEVPITNVRPLPNSINTLLNYPLVSTCTAAILNNNTNPNVSLSHRRALSSPEPLLSPAEGEMVSDHTRSHQKSSSGSWEMAPEVTPPGTPPPPYPSPLNDENNSSGWGNVVATSSPFGSTLFSGSDITERPVLTPGAQVIHAAQSHVVQKEIISMEDDDTSDTEIPLDEHGPFKAVSKLLERPAHLSVFLNYLLSNSQPAPMLFYLITDLYKEGTAKDMKKWAYEIHSTFLVPNAPLQLKNVDETVAREIDDVLLNDSDKEEILRKIFFKARMRAKEELTVQLNEFQVKRTVGLATLYGPSDDVLQDTIYDKRKELEVVEVYLLPKLDNYFQEETDASVDAADVMKRKATGSALATVLLRVFGVRHGTHGGQSAAALDRCPTFVSREKSFKTRLIGKSRKLVVKGHHLVARQYYAVTYCNQCQNIIWGIGPQGFHCTDCDLNIHQKCSKILDEDCLGPNTHSKSKMHQNDRISKLMKILPTSHFISAERCRRQEEDAIDNESVSSNDRPSSVSLGRNPSDRRPDNPSLEKLETDTADHQDAEIDKETPKPKSAPVSVNRSESYKERLSHKRNMRIHRRKTSDPNLSKTNDEPLDITGLTQAMCSGSSSTSSLSSRSLDSPSASLEQVGVASVGRTEDSDDADEDSNWARLVPPDVLATLSDKEKERQEVINELIYTERKHARTLLLLERLFYKPLQENNVLPTEHLQLLFPASFRSLQNLHSSFSIQLKKRQKEGAHVVDGVGDLLLSMFDGPAGEELKQSAATFCARQQIALEGLKERRRKDARLQALLSESESHTECRRLQLKDLLPTALQRLTKYPLLFESLVKCTAKENPDPTEYQSLQKAVELSKQILNHVNHAVREAEDYHRLQTIQTKLDKSSFEKVEGHPIVSEFKSLDLTRHRLIHEGTLYLRLDGKAKPGVALHALLLDEVIILLQKQDDKYLMKFHQATGVGEPTKCDRASPIIKLSTLLIRQHAAVKNTFFVIITSHSQMYEFVTPTSSEYKVWFKHISEAAEAYKARPKNTGPVDVDSDSSHEPVIDSNTMDSMQTDNNLETTSEDTTLENESEPHDGDHNMSDTLSSSASNVDTTQTDVEAGDASGDGDMDKTRDVAIGGSDETTKEGDSVLGTILLTQGTTLVAPSEVTISVSPIHTAEPVLTTYERLRRADIAVRDALDLKQRLVGEILSIPPEHYSVIADMASMGHGQEPAEVLLTAIQQAQSLTHIINDSITISEQKVILSTQMKTTTATQLCDKCNQKHSQSRKESYNQTHKISETEQNHQTVFENENLSSVENKENLTENVEHELKDIIEVLETTEIFEDAITIVENKNTESNLTPSHHSCCDIVEQLVLPVIATHKVVDTSNAINSTLTQLLEIIRERDNERDSLRKELQRCRELLHHLHGQNSQMEHDLPAATAEPDQ